MTTVHVLEYVEGTCMRSVWDMLLLRDVVSPRECREMLVCHGDRVKATFIDQLTGNADDIDYQGISYSWCDPR
jgi:hypothetical protein